MPAVVLGNTVCRGLCEFFLVYTLGTVFGCENNSRRLPDRLVTGIPEQMLCPNIPLLNYPHPVMEKNGVTRNFFHQLKKVFFTHGLCYYQTWVPHSVLWCT